VHGLTIDILSLAAFDIIFNLLKAANIW